MPNRLVDICAFLDESVPELRGDHVHFTAKSGVSEIRVAMSRHEARKMAECVIIALDNAEGGLVLPFGRTG